mmetsp:Transcript_4293/g.16802  ORF Transcript_4293/g.16802 Transcript_4293/m.16802 type:complete len:205 (-) Transcript_4293:660-1274(-)
MASAAASMPSSSSSPAFSLLRPDSNASFCARAAVSWTFATSMKLRRNSKSGSSSISARRCSSARLFKAFLLAPLCSRRTPSVSSRRPSSRSRSASLACWRSQPFSLLTRSSFSCAVVMLLARPTRSLAFFILRSSTGKSRNGDLKAWSGSASVSDDASARSAPTILSCLASSMGATRDTERPWRVARAVRPARCTKVCTLPGMS